jgi:hypothetical protein
MMNRLMRRIEDPLLQLQAYASYSATSLFFRSLFVGFVIYISDMDIRMLLFNHKSCKFDSLLLL